jgi:hypothetical protein
LRKSSSCTKRSWVTCTGSCQTRSTRSQTPLFLPDPRPPTTATAGGEVSTRCRRIRTPCRG